MLQIRRLQLDDTRARAAWDAYVLATPQASFFHRSGWQAVVEDVFSHASQSLYAERDGVVCGILPLAHVRSWLFGSALTSLPFAVYGGVVADDEEVAAALETEAGRAAARLGVRHLELRQVGRQHADWPRQDLYVTFRRAILPQVQDNLLAVPRKQRAMVRKGMAAGLASRIDDSLDSFFALYADNVHRHGTPALPRRWFERLRGEFGRDCEVLTVSQADGAPLSSVLSFYFRDEVLPYYAGDAPAARTVAANDFKYWELMRRACERGLRSFDFGRSKRGSGSFAFKKNWGFEPQALHYEYRLYGGHAVPQNNPSNAKFRLFIEAWRRMPIGWANRLGPVLVRGLG